VADLLDLFRRVPRIPALSSSTERRFLLAALELAPGAEVTRWARSVLDWSEALEIARRYAVSQVVGSLMSRGDIRRHVPEPLAEAFRADYEAAAVQNQLIRRDLKTVAGLLDEAGLPYVALKGSVLITGHYSDPARRHVDDIDILVRPDDVPGVESALSAGGFTKVDGDFNRDRHPLCMMSPAETKVEVHVALARGDTSMVWARAERRDLDGVPVSMTAPTDLLYHLCHHVLVQHAEDPRFLPRHLGDLDALLPAVDDYDPSEPSVQASLTLLELARRRSSSEVRARMLALMLFPSHHTLAPTAMSARLRAAAGGAGIRRPRLRGARRKLFFEIR